MAYQVHDPRFCPNDTGPFASAVYAVAKDGPGPQELDLKLHDRDVLLVIEYRSDLLLVLHLENVREDTVTDAHPIIDDFLTNLEVGNDLTGAGAPSSPQHASVFTRALDIVHAGLQFYMEDKSMARDLEFQWHFPSYPNERAIDREPTYRVVPDGDKGWNHEVGYHMVWPSQ